MNREILFKAKRTDNGEWVEGGLISFDAESGYVFIVASYPYASTLPVRVLIRNQLVLVDPETVCQYTGLTDKDGEKIWENDIVLIRSNSIDEEDGYFTVAWDDEKAGFELDGNEFITDFDSIYGFWCEVCGNVFDNPELLEGE